MSINGIGTARCPSVGYMTRKMEKKCGIRDNGMMSHISQMMVQRLNKMLKGETENFTKRF